MMVRESSSMESCNVALNNERTNEGLEQTFSTESICSINPSSNSLFDSSRMRYSTLHQEPIKNPEHDYTQMISQLPTHLYERITLT